MGKGQVLGEDTTGTENSDTAGNFTYPQSKCAI